MTGLRDKAAAANGGEIERRDEGAVAPRQSIANWIEQLKPEMAKALPATMSADRMARLVLTEVRKNPDLGNCTPASVAGAVLTSAALGLDIGLNGEAYIVPYEHRSGALRGTTECQFQVGYQGYAKLFFQHPLASDLDVEVVYAADEFDYALGTDKYLRHRPAKSTKDRGEIVFYYAVAKLTTGATHFVVLTPDEVKELRRGKVGPSGRIADPQRWMERKTVLKQCLKVLPKSVTMSRAMAAEEVGGAELQRERITERQIRAAQGEEPGPDEGGPVTTDAPPAEGTPVTVRPADDPEYVDAEVVSDDDPVVPDPSDGDDPWVTQPPITDDQRTRIHASLSDLEITNRDDKLAFCGDVIGRTIESSNDLTLPEASQIIEVLNHHLEAKGITPGGGA